jgi:chromosome segregation ATPase
MPKKPKAEPLNPYREMYSGSEKNKQDLQYFKDELVEAKKRRRPKSPPYESMYPETKEALAPLDKAIAEMEESIKTHRKKFVDSVRKERQEARQRGGGGGGGGLLPTDIEKVPGKRPLKMAKGGKVKKPAVKKRRGYGLAKR